MATFVPKGNRNIEVCNGGKKKEGGSPLGEIVCEISRDVGVTNEPGSVISVQKVRKPKAIPECLSGDINPFPGWKGTID